MTRRTDTRYIFTAGGQTYIGWWRREFKIQTDARSPDAAANAAFEAGWEGRYAGTGFGTKTSERIRAYFRVKAPALEWEWEPQ